MEQLSPEQKVLYAERVWHYMRYVAGTLTPAEQAVMRFVIERTLAFDKLRETIPMRHFIEGVKWDGKVQIMPVGLSTRTINTTINKLVERGILRREAVNGSKNTVYIFVLNKGETEQTYAKHDTNLCKKGGRFIYNNRIIKNNCAPTHARTPAKDFPMSSSRDELAENVNSAIAKNRQARDNRKRKLNATGLMKIWEDAFREHYPDEVYFAWRNYEVAAFKRSLSRGIPQTEIEAFTIFCVEHYGNVITERLSWMKTSREVPSVATVIRQVDVFYQAYQERNDPNRRLRNNVKRADIKPEQQKDTAKHADPEQTEKVEKLEKEVRRLRAKIGKDKQAVALRRIKAPRKPEGIFGEWGKPKT